MNSLNLRGQLFQTKSASKKSSSSFQTPRGSTSHSVAMRDDSCDQSSSNSTGITSATLNQQQQRATSYYIPQPCSNNTCSDLVVEKLSKSYSNQHHRPSTAIDMPSSGLHRPQQQSQSSLGVNNPLTTSLTDPIGQVTMNKQSSGKRIGQSVNAAITSSNITSSSSYVNSIINRSRSPISRTQIPGSIASFAQNQSLSRSSNLNQAATSNSSLNNINNVISSNINSSTTTGSGIVHQKDSAGQNGISTSSNSRQLLVTPTKQSNRIFQETSPHTQQYSGLHPRSIPHKSPRQLSSPNQHHHISNSSQTNVNNNNIHFNQASNSSQSNYLQVTNTSTELQQKMERNPSTSKTIFLNTQSSIVDDDTQIFKQQPSTNCNSNKRQYPTPTQMRKVHQQSHSYHNLQQYLHANGSIATPSSTAKKPGSSNISSSFIDNFALSASANSNQGQVTNSSQPPVPPRQSNSQSKTRLNVKSMSSTTMQSSQIQYLQLQQQQQQLQVHLNPSQQHSTQKTSSSLPSSTCLHCNESQRELEMLRNILKSCKSCSNSFLSISEQQQQQFLTGFEKKQILQQSQPSGDFNENLPSSCSSNNSGNGNNSSNNAHSNGLTMKEKMVNQLLQEQVQQLTKQLEEVAADRDAFKVGNGLSQTELMITRIQAQEAQIKSMRSQISLLEKKISSYVGLKDFVEKEVIEKDKDIYGLKMRACDVIENCRKTCSCAEHNNSMTLECNFLKQYLSENIKNESSDFFTNSVKFQKSNVVKVIGNNLGNTGIERNGEILQHNTGGGIFGFGNTGNAIPSTIKALEIVNRIKQLTSQNPFVSSNLLQ